MITILYIYVLVHLHFSFWDSKFDINYGIIIVVVIFSLYLPVTQDYWKANAMKKEETKEKKINDRIDNPK